MLTTTELQDAEQPEYVVELESVTQRIRATFNNQVIADSTEAKVLYETRHEPVYYFPIEDVREGFLNSSQLLTNCPFKGNANHWDIQVGKVSVADAVWRYKNPQKEFNYLKDYYGFYSDKFDDLIVGDRVEKQKNRFRSSTYSNPLIEWLLNEAWDTKSEAELVHKFSRCLVNAGIPIWRFFITIPTLHPLLTGVSYSWYKDKDEVETRLVEHSVIQSDVYLNSPIRSIFEGAGGIRRHLDTEDAQFDFPILQELKNKGATDYVAMPLTFSNGQINVISFTSDRAGGFNIQELGHLNEIMPLLSRLFEVHSARYIAASLLTTYLGEYTGKQVLDGKIKRGDGEIIYAVIWFCDLRQSSLMAESMSQKEFLGTLNDFFDCMGGAIINHGGEVLRFIGDAALAIFPIGNRSDDCCGNLDAEIKQAGQKAINAVEQAQQDMALLNAQRQKNNRPALRYGVGLNLGEVTYGNIGTSSRLEFTVIGSAANEAAKMESLCKQLNKSILISDSLAKHFPDKMTSLGKFDLSGIKEKRELYILR